MNPSFYLSYLLYSHPKIMWEKSYTKKKSKLIIPQNLLYPGVERDYFFLTARGTYDLENVQEWMFSSDRTEEMAEQHWLDNRWLSDPVQINDFVASVLISEFL